MKLGDMIASGVLLYLALVLCIITVVIIEMYIVSKAVGLEVYVPLMNFILLTSTCFFLIIAFWVLVLVILMYKFLTEDRAKNEVG